MYIFDITYNGYNERKTLRPLEHYNNIDIVKNICNMVGILLMYVLVCTSRVEIDKRIYERKFTNKYKLFVYTFYTLQYRAEPKHSFNLSSLS